MKLKVNRDDWGTGASMEVEVPIDKWDCVRVRALRCEDGTWTPAFIDFDGREYREPEYALLMSRCLFYASFICRELDNNPEVEEVGLDIVPWQLALNQLIVTLGGEDE